jgi:hypothetical protein
VPGEELGQLLDEAVGLVGVHHVTGARDHLDLGAGWVARNGSTSSGPEHGAECRVGSMHDVAHHGADGMSVSRPSDILETL